MTKASRLACVVATVCVTILGADAKAGPLALDPNAFLRGTTPMFFSINPAPGVTFEVSANVDYGVYAPGAFNLTFGPGADPSTGTQYVYAYEVFNTGANGVNTFAQPISFFSERIGGAAAQAQNIEALPLAFGNFGQLPDHASFAGTPVSSAAWDYSTHNLPLGSATQILLFTSPNGPTTLPGGVSGGGLGAQGNLPSPAPEPSSLILLLVGGALLSAIRFTPTRHKRTISQ